MSLRHASLAHIHSDLPAAAARGCEEKTYAVGILGYNHTDKAIGQFQINGGSGGSFVAPHSGGQGNLLRQYPSYMETRPASKRSLVAWKVRELTGASEIGTEVHG